MRLIEVPFMIAQSPLFANPWLLERTLLDVASEDMNRAMHAVDLQCRIDLAFGRAFTPIHLTSHPWEFSEIGPWGRDGRARAKVLTQLLGELSANYDTEFLSVDGFRATWETRYCPLHAVGA
jgi:hypothetical protein